MTTDHFTTDQRARAEAIKVAATVLSSRNFMSTTAPASPDAVEAMLALARYICTGDHTYTIDLTEGSQGIPLTYGGFGGPVIGTATVTEDDDGLKVSGKIYSDPTREIFTSSRNFDAGALRLSGVARDTNDGTADTVAEEDSSRPSAPLQPDAGDGSPKAMSSAVTLVQNEPASSPAPVNIGASRLASAHVPGCAVIGVHKVPQECQRFHPGAERGPYFDTNTDGD